ncbi:EpsG family protein [Bacillus sp. es.036]|uniref:EpsG family protein n=1 Tax=Bacillus sp. es.036 TaxID=1761764 RepID=UPI000BF2A879|nr:EpsG family protein [Bacillus sp. es.036]PFG15091.1 EpsG-like putative glucosyltransferase [Bacillus sp. es.036]
MLIFFLIMLLSLTLLSAQPNSILNNKYNVYVILFCLILFITFKIGALEIDSTNDMPIYFQDFLNYHQLSLFEALDYSDKERLFTIMQWTFSKISISPIFFKVASWLLFITLFLISLKKIFNPYQILAILIGYITNFIFFAYILNTMRQGLAISILFIALLILISGKKQDKTFYIAIICAPLVHVSALPLSLALFVLKIFDVKLRSLITIWIFSALLFLTHLNKVVLGVVGDIFISSYSDGSLLNVYTGGVNRLDFFVFSMVFLLWGLWIRRLLKYKVNFNMYNKLLKIYVMFNIYFLLLGFVTYSDRIAAFSWFLIPLLILLPLTTLKQYNPLLTSLVLLILLLIGFYNGSVDILIS